MSKILIRKEVAAPINSRKSTAKKHAPVGGIIIKPTLPNTFDQVDELVASIKLEIGDVQKNDTFVVLNKIDKVIKDGKEAGKTEDEIYNEVDVIAKENSIYVEHQVPKRKKFQLIKIVEKYPRRYAKFITRFSFNPKPAPELIKGEVVGSKKERILVINNPSKRTK